MKPKDYEISVTWTSGKKQKIKLNGYPEDIRFSLCKSFKDTVIFLGEPADEFYNLHHAIKVEIHE